MNKNPKPRSGKNLPKEKVQQILKKFSSMPTAQLAKELKIKPATIRIIAARKKIKKNYWNWKKWEDDVVLKYYETHGWNYIANKTGRKKWAIINRYRVLIGKKNKNN